MQNLDHDKLSEFTSELSSFQTEASKTASVDVYDRFTISSLEDRAVDLCQLSMDASHSGLQYLCERLRDNIRDHFITGTNISSDEFALMTEWKSLVKAYLINDKNEGVVNALAINLSKSGWTYPLSPDDTDDVVNVLLGKSSDTQPQSKSNGNGLNAADSEEFDAFMSESNTSLADVFESFQEDDEEESVIDFSQEKEPSIAEFFENDEFSTPSADLNQKQLSPQEDDIAEQAREDLDEADLPEIDEAITQTMPNDMFGADDNTDSSIDKVEVSAQELDEIDATVSARSAVEDELFVADDDAVEPEYDEAFDKDLSAAESALADNADSSVDKVEVSAQELDEIDATKSEVAGEADSSDEEENDFSDTAVDLECQPDNSSANLADSAATTNEPETVYLEPVEKKQEAPKSIIEAYVDVIANKIRENKPKVLEQELIKEPPKPAPIQKLEPVDSILLKYPDWGEEQKELLSLILSEVHDVVGSQDETLSVLHQDKAVEQDVLDMVSLYSEQIERMGSAAEMVGLDALQKLCELIGFHFGDLEKSSTEMIISSEERIRQWPFIIYDYLKNIHNEKAHQNAIDYISDDAWARTIREDIKTDLKEAFSHSTIHIDKTDDDERIIKASSQDVDITVPDDVQAELLDGLLQELPRQTEEFSAAIQQLVKDDYLAQLELTQRIAHTIKGAANTVGIVGVATLTHHLEDILQALLKAKAKPGADLHMGLIDASDCLEQMTECLLGQGEQPDDAVQTLQVILDWANYIDEFGIPKDNVEKPLLESSSKITQSEEKPETKEKEHKSRAMQDASLRVPSNMIDNLINQSGESIIATSQMHENVNKLLASMRDIKKNKDNVYSLSQQLEHLIDIQGTSNKLLNGEKNEKFDSLELDQYNELHTYSRRLIEATADSVELIKDLEDRLFSLESVIADQTRAQKDNQYAILKTRMIPVESVVARLKRGVRQAAKISGKSIELEVQGVDTLLDSKILNNLIDPLMHLLRNAVDHGIETNEVREACGKPLPGMIKLTFAHVGERLEIKCHDDGKGLDTEAIKARAIDKGMILNDRELSNEEIHQIIMQHGFSTRNEVTQLSGRGVGMDVVYSNIKELNGSIVINSELNKGMDVELSLPVSLLTAHALLIPAISGSMAVSASGIEEILQVNPDKLKETEQGLMLEVEDEVFPAVHLEQLLNMRLTSPSNKQQGYTALLVNEFAGQKKVVLVSEIQSVRDIIIKPISHYLPKVVGLVGATVLGNGDIAPVVDVADLLSQHSNVIGKLNIDNTIDLEETYQASVLVVEDSISTRRSLAEFMKDLNYQVFTAKDGVEAIEIMRDHSPTLLLTDLEMPRMNGLELTSYIRSHDETKDIPIIMLTSRTTEKHRQEAKSIGVNEYLTKPFVEDTLLEKVQSLSIIK